MRKTIVVLWIIGLITMSAWMLFAGQFTEVLNGIHAFISNPDIKNILSGRETSVFLTKLLVFDFWINIGICFSVLFLVALFRGRLPNSNDDILKELAKRNLFGFFSRLLGAVSIEEFYFRWLPLAVLFPLWGNQSLFWFFVIGSSAIFAFVHVFNETSLSQRVGRIPFTICQFVAGLILCYVFLVFGLAPTILLHTSFNFILFFPYWLIARRRTTSTISNIDPRPVYKDDKNASNKQNPFEGHFTT